MKILLTGATGFVGRRLLPKLLQEGHDVRCMVRNRDSHAAKEIAKAYSDINRVEILEADATKQDSLRQAVQDCDTAYYLIHSMGSRRDFRELDRLCAANFVKATSESFCQRIIYVSGLANEQSPQLSDHLASRIEVGRILRSGEATSFELRAAMIIGSGSLSFRIVKHLCHRLPVMLCPKWLQTKTQPLAIDDLLRYLVHAAKLRQDWSDVFELGGADSATYLDILKEYCRQKQLNRIMIPVPFLSTKLSSYWLRVVTPETADVGRELIDGLRNENLVRSQAASRAFGIKPMTISEAIRIAIARENYSESFNPLSVPTVSSEIIQT